MPYKLRYIKLRYILFTLAAIMLGLSIVTESRAEKEVKPPGVELRQKLRSKIPLQLRFQNEKGQSIQLKSLLPDDKKPLLIVPGYYKCIRMCSFVFKGVAKAIGENLKHGLVPGRDYHAVAISINPEDTAIRALITGNAYRKEIAEGPINPIGWRFLTGNQRNIKKLMDSLGYYYKKDGPDFSHPAAVMIITPRGVISRYLDGLNIPSQSFRFSLIEAADGRIGKIIDRAFQLCFRWDNQKGRYAPIAWRFIQLGGLLTLFTLIGLIFFLRRQRIKT